MGQVEGGKDLFYSIPILKRHSPPPSLQNISISVFALPTHSSQRNSIRREMRRSLIGRGAARDVTTAACSHWLSGFLAPAGILNDYAIICAAEDICYRSRKLIGFFSFTPGYIFFCWILNILIESLTLEGGIKKFCKAGVLLANLSSLSYSSPFSWWTLTPP